MNHYIFLLISLFLFGNVNAFASPVSGQFSNFTKLAKSEAFTEIVQNDTLETRVNLVVTSNYGGQQFFIQCLYKNELGFGKITKFKKPRSKARIQTGQYCPFSEAEVKFDDGWIILTANGKSTVLIQGAINVPIKE